MIGGGRRRDGDEEVSLTAGRHVTQHPPGSLADHLSGRVHTLDSQANIGDPPGKAIVEVSLDPRPSMKGPCFLHLHPTPLRPFTHPTLPPPHHLHTTNSSIP